MAGETDMLPGFLGIGAQKAGTTWLHAVLSTHQEIWLPHLKELHYFDRKFPITNPAGSPKDIPNRGIINRHIATRLRRIDAAKLRERLSIRRWGDISWEIRYLFGDWTDEWYASLFAAAKHRLAGEITPAYSCLGELAISHVHRIMPNAKLILLLRDPIDRAWSHARMDLARSARPHRMTPSFSEYIEHFGGHASRLRGDYVGIIRRWRTRFAESQLFVGFYEEIESNPEDLLLRIFRFLGVSANYGNIPGNVRKRVNAGSRAVIPIELHHFLATLYVDGIRELANTYGSHPQRWLENCQSALDRATATQ